MVNLVEEKPHKSLSVQERREHPGTCKELHAVGRCAATGKPQGVGILEASDTVLKQWQNLYSVYNP